MSRMIACVLLSGVLHAQDVYLEKWRASSAGQTPDVKLAISVPKATFYMGEVIPLKLAFTSSTPNAFSATAAKGCAIRQDGVDVFVLDPVESTGDPLGGPQLVTAENCLMPTPALLSNTLLSVERILNKWVYFKKPGVYRVYVISHRVWPASEPLPGTSQFALTSNVLALEIQATPPEWAAEQLAAAVKVLDQPVVRESSVATQARGQAAAVLRFLDTPEATAERAKRMLANGGRLIPAQ